MSNSTYNEREKLKTLYGPQWRAKVDKMSDNQVIAVFRRFQSKKIL